MGGSGLAGNAAAFRGQRALRAGSGPGVVTRPVDPLAGGHLFLRGAQVRLFQRLACRLQLGCPEVARVVFHPAGLRVDLGQLQLGLRHHAALRIEHDAARAGGSLVQGKQIGHGFTLGIDGGVVPDATV